jgi:hypothetical protein
MAKMRVELYSNDAYRNRSCMIFHAAGDPPECSIEGMRNEFQISSDFRPSPIRFDGSERRTAAKSAFLFIID